MNMQNYRHAADRVHIAAHCRQAVLNMTKNSNPKTGTPVCRMAAAITAGAAVLAVLGGCGYLLFSMHADEYSVQTTPAASQLEELTSAESYPDEPAVFTYADYFRDYYEVRAGHSVDFDFSSLCGTDINETWESDDCAVTLNAAVCDGWEIDYIYTITPHDKESWSIPTYADMPRVVLELNGDMIEQVSCSLYQIDAELRADGTFRVFGTFHFENHVLPIPKHLKVYADCLFANDSTNHVFTTTRVVNVKIPDEIPELTEMDGILTVALDPFTTFTGVAGDIKQFMYAIVTPLGITLTNYNPDELHTLLQDIGYDQNRIYRKGNSTQADAVTVQKCMPEAEPQKLALPYTNVLNGSRYNIMAVSLEDTTEFVTCRLPFAEPQNLSEISELLLHSNVQDTSALICINPAE